MADTVLKLAQPPSQEKTEPKGSSRRLSLLGMMRARIRLILLVVVPAIVVLGGLAFYLTGGRYISTDNAYIGAQKVLITPDISGKVSQVTVHEGQHVAAGNPLFGVDPVPFQLALQQAQSKLATVRTDFDNLKSNYQSLSQLVALGEQSTQIKRRDLERKQTLLKTHAGSQADVDSAEAALVTAELQLQVGRQQLATTLN